MNPYNAFCSCLTDLSISMLGKVYCFVCMDIDLLLVETRHQSICSYFPKAIVVEKHNGIALIKIAPALKRYLKMFFNEMKSFDKPSNNCTKR